MWHRQRQSEGKLVRFIREIDLFGTKPFADYRAKGSIDFVMQRVLGQSLSAQVGKMVGENRTVEDIHTQASEVLNQMLKESGVYVTSSKKRAEAIRKHIDSGDLKFLEMNGNKVWIAQGEAFDEFSGKKGVVDANKEGVMLNIDVSTYKELLNSGDLSPIDLGYDDFKARKGSKNYIKALDRFAKIMKIQGREEAEAYFELMRSIMKEQKNLPKEEQKSIGIVPAMLVTGTRAEFDKYEYGNEVGEGDPSQKVGRIMLGSNTEDAFVFNQLSTIGDISEELLESSVKSILADEKYSGVAAGIQRVIDILDITAKEAGVGVSGIELLSKTLLTRVFDISRREYTTSLMQMDLNEEQISLLQGLAKDLVGDSVFNQIMASKEFDSKEAPASAYVGAVEKIK
jgi:hypothetical protein